MPYKTKQEKKEYDRKYYLEKRDLSHYKRYYSKNKESLKNKQREYYKNADKSHIREQRKKYEERLKNIVYTELGNKCNCCGETIKKFLTIDHIQGGGSKHRKQTTNSRMLYLDIIKQGIPKDKFQILCCNCNMGKYRNNGICPHKIINE